MTDTTTTSRPSGMDAVLRLRSPDTDPGFTGWCRRYLADPASRVTDLPIRYPVLDVKDLGQQEVLLLAGAFRRVANRPGQNLGRALASTARSQDGPQEETLKTRLLALVRQPHPVALTSLRSLVAMFEQASISLDWDATRWSFSISSWEDSELHARDCHYWAVGFYSTLPEERSESVPNDSDSTKEPS